MRSFRISGSRLPCWVEWGSLVVAVPLAVLVVSGSHERPSATQGAQVREDNRVSLEYTRARLEQYFEEAHLELRVIGLQHKVVATGEDTRGVVKLPVRTGSRPRRFADVRIIPRQPDRESPPRREGTRQIRHRHVPALEDDPHGTHLRHLERFAEDPALEVLLSGPVSDRTVDPRLVLSVPIRADGELVGIVAGAVPLESMLQTLRQDAGADHVVLASNRGDIFGQADLPCETDVFREGATANGEFERMDAGHRSNCEPFHGPAFGETVAPLDTPSTYCETRAGSASELRTVGAARFFETHVDQFDVGRMPAVWCRPDIPGDLNWYLAVMHRDVGEAKTDQPSRGTVRFPG